MSFHIILPNISNDKQFSKQYFLSSISEKISKVLMNKIESVSQIFGFSVFASSTIFLFNPIWTIFYWKLNFGWKNVSFQRTFKNIEQK